MSTLTFIPVGHSGPTAYDLGSRNYEYNTQARMVTPNPSAINPFFYPDYDGASNDDGAAKKRVIAMAQRLRATDRVLASNIEGLATGRRLPTVSLGEAIERIVAEDRGIVSSAPETKVEEKKAPASNLSPEDRQGLDQFDRDAVAELKRLENEIASFGAQASLFRWARGSTSDKSLFAARASLTDSEAFRAKVDASLDRRGFTGDRTPYYKTVLDRLNEAKAPTGDLFTVDARGTVGKVEVNLHHDSFERELGIDIRRAERKEQSDLVSTMMEALGRREDASATLEKQSIARMTVATKTAAALRTLGRHKEAKLAEETSGVIDKYRKLADETSGVVDKYRQDLEVIQSTANQMVTATQDMFTKSINRAQVTTKELEDKEAAFKQTKAQLDKDIAKSQSEAQALQTRINQLNNEGNNTKNRITSLAAYALKVQTEYAKARSVTDNEANIAEKGAMLDNIQKELTEIQLEVKEHEQSAAVSAAEINQLQTQLQQAKDTQAQAAQAAQAAQQAAQQAKDAQAAQATREPAVMDVDEAVESKQQAESGFAGREVERGPRPGRTGAKTLPAIRQGRLATTKGSQARARKEEVATARKPTQPNQPQASVSTRPQRDRAKGLNAEKTAEVRFKRKEHVTTKGKASRATEVKEQRARELKEPEEQEEPEEHKEQQLPQVSTRPQREPIKDTNAEKTAASRFARKERVTKKGRANRATEVQEQRARKLQDQKDTLKKKLQDQKDTLNKDITDLRAVLGKRRFEEDPKSAKQMSKLMAKRDAIRDQLANMSDDDDL